MAYENGASSYPKPPAWCVGGDGHDVSGRGRMCVGKRGVDEGVATLIRTLHSSLWPSRMALCLLWLTQCLVRSNSYVSQTCLLTTFCLLSTVYYLLLASVSTTAFGAHTLTSLPVHFLLLILFTRRMKQNNDNDT